METQLTQLTEAVAKMEPEELRALMGFCRQQLGESGLYDPEHVIWGHLADMFRVCITKLTGDIAPQLEGPFVDYRESAA